MVFLVRNNYIKQESTLELFPEMISLRLVAQFVPSMFVNVFLDGDYLNDIVIHTKNKWI